jgi:hypothetical protein
MAVHQVEINFLKDERQLLEYLRDIHKEANFNEGPESLYSLLWRLFLY